jgi:UDP-3-O-[3-hydroxymyristoyl] glucosamine N-acyltransferase
MPTLAELAALTGGTVEGSASLEVNGIASVEDAAAGQLTFITSPKFLEKLGASRASAVLIGPGLDTKGKPAIRVPNASAALVILLGRFAPVPPAPAKPVDPSAWIHPTAKVAPGAVIGPNAVVDAEAEIGEGSVVGALSYVGWQARIGKGCRIFPLVALGERVTVGNGVIIHSGTVLGGDGFGFTPGPAGVTKIPQIGTVVIEDAVEIGANCTIDRAMAGATIIRKGAKLDDQVHIAHNCVVGEQALVAAQVGMAGTAVIGRGVMFGGQVGVGDHVTIGDGARIAGGAGVHKDVPPGVDMFGYPARPAREAMKSLADVMRIPKMNERIRALEARIAELEKNRGVKGS